jgi:hypothetical protein
MDTYEAQSRTFLDAQRLEVLIAFKEDHQCLPRAPHIPGVKCCRKCGMVHHKQYPMTVRRAETTFTPIHYWRPGPTKAPHAISFAFRASLLDRKDPLPPHTPDGQARVSGDASYPANPLDFIAEVGVDPHSRPPARAGSKSALACSRQG